jgi:hypothetical protein
MTYSNLAIVFGPTILYGPKADAMTFAVVNGVGKICLIFSFLIVLSSTLTHLMIFTVESMIQYYEELFGEPISADRFGVRPRRPDRPMSIIPRAGALGFPKTPPPDRPGSQFGGILPNDIAAAAAAAVAERPNRPPTVSVESPSPKQARPGSQFGLHSMPLKSKPPVSSGLEKPETPERPTSLWQSPATPQASLVKKPSLFSRASSGDALRRASVDYQDPISSNPTPTGIAPKEEPSPTYASEDLTPSPEAGGQPGAMKVPSRPPLPSRTERPVLAETGSGTNLNALLKRSDSGFASGSLTGPVTPLSSPETSGPATIRERPPRPQRPPSVSPRSFSISDDAPPSNIGFRKPDFAPPVLPGGNIARRSYSVADVNEAKAHMVVASASLPSASSLRGASPSMTGDLLPSASTSSTEGGGGEETEGEEYWGEGGDEQFVEVEYDLDDYQGEYRYEDVDGVGDGYYDENNQEFYEENAGDGAEEAFSS